MICPFCGAGVNDTAIFCEKCGKRLRAGTQAPPQTVGVKYESKCRWCGYPLTLGNPICSYCLRDNSERDPNRKLGAMLAAGGLTIIVAGMISLAATIALALPEVDTYAENPTDFSIYIILGMFAVFAIGLGFLPLKRKNFTLSLAGGIFSLLGGAFFIGVFGLILIILGRKVFIE
jgi:amino acid transporter